MFRETSEHCNHSLPSSVYHSPHVEHSLSLLLNFSWPETTSLVFCTTECERLPGLPSSWKFLYCNLYCHWSVEQICGLKVFRGDGMWYISAISSDLGKFTVIIDSTNFMKASDNSLDVWTTIWPDFTFWKMTFLMVPPTLCNGTLPWCPSLKNQHNDLLRSIVPANSWKINLDRSWVPIPSLHKTRLVNNLPHFVTTVSITFFRQLIDVILLWSEFLVTTTTLFFTDNCNTHTVEYLRK